jgi:hypothetical protein
MFTCGLNKVSLLISKACKRRNRHAVEVECCGCLLDNQVATYV